MLIFVKYTYIWHTTHNYTEMYADRSMHVYKDDPYAASRSSANVQRYRQLVGKLKKTRVEQIILSGMLPVMGGRGVAYRNCKRMAINVLVEQMCEEEGVGFVDL